MSRIAAIVSRYKKIKELYLRYERVLMPVTMVIGFLVDYITFTNIQIRTTFTVLFAYWVLAGLVLLFVHAFDAEKLSARFKYGRLFAPLAIQFLFGAMLGGSFIFYWFSGSLSASWPIIIIFTVLMFSNDALRHYYEKPIVQIAVYYFITLSLCSVWLPFGFNSLSPWLFVLAGATSLLLIILFVVLIARVRKFGHKQKFQLFVPPIVILLCMNVLYFANIIPPIPLAIREAGVYHNVKRTDGKYVLTGEPESRWQQYLPGQTIHIVEGERVYVYSAIFAPTDLHATIIHDWQWYNVATKKWEHKGNLPFEIIGARKEGFRGYSWKSALALGKWRVDVKTERGQVLGRVRFTIERTSEPVPLVEQVR